MTNDKENYGFGYGSQISGGVNYGNQNASNPTQPTTQSPSSLAMPGTTQAPLPVKDISTAEFMAEVIQASTELPVLVDFWAPWCGPCKQLAPILESAVAKTNGKLKLVKLNIDEHPEIPGKMGVQSIPAVVAFVDGQPKNAFTGAKTASEIEMFINELVGPEGPSQLDIALEQAKNLLDENQLDEAGQIYSMILQQIPNNIPAITGLGLIALEKNDLEKARDIAALAPEDTKDVDFLSFVASIGLKEQAGELGDISHLQDQVSKNPNDHQLRFDLAIALNGNGEKEKAAENLLEIISKDRNWHDDGAKNQLLQFFEAWGQTDPVTISARRQLSSLLFA